MSPRQGEDFYPVDNFFDDENFAGEKPEKQTMEAILKDIMEIYFILPETNVQEEIVVGNLEIADGLVSVLLIPEFSDEHTNLHLLEIYKPESNERMMDDFIASLVFYPPEEQERLVVFDIYSNIIRKRFKEDGFDPEEKNEIEEVFGEAIEYRENLYELERESEELAERIGLDFVSEKTATRVQSIIRQYKRHLNRYLETPD